MTIPAGAQTAVMDRNLIVIDPAHGGADAGGLIGGPLGGQLQEKDITLAFAAKLKAVFVAGGFNVAMTRKGDLDAGSPDQRAEMANRTHAVACLVLHASQGTSGVILGTSALGTALMRAPRGSEIKPARGGVPWSRAQELYIAQSDRLANEAGTALDRSNIPVTIMRVEMRPLDSLTCPAISVELGLLRATKPDTPQVSDDVYEQRVAESLANALVAWRKLAQPPEFVQSAANAAPEQRPGDAVAGCDPLIPRYQKTLFYCLLASIVTMAIFLFHERQIVRDRWDAKIDATPLLPPSSAVETAVTLDMASDRDGTITAVQRQVALPEEASVRARALLDRLVAEYALPRSDHPLPEGTAVEDVFLLKWPPVSPTKAWQTSGELAVINLRGSFANQHPSGVQTEMLSVLSMLGTLHENFPEIAEVQFVVDGRSRETVAGHVDLERQYPAIDTTVAANDLQPAP